MGCVFQFFLTVTFFSVSEVSLLLYVAQNTGILFTMACCVLTGILGGYFVRQQGLATFARFRQTLDQGVLPADEAIEGLLLLIVGVLLCVPGFITDFMGFMIVIPAIRKFVARMLINRLKANISAGNIRFSSGFAGPQTDQNFSQPGQADNQPNESSIENATIVEEIIDEKRQERTEK